MLLGLVYHATTAYLPDIGPYYPVVNPASSDALKSLAAGLHAFRMEVFFALSGFFAALVLARRGPIELLRHRLRRLALPFAVAVPLTLAADVATRRLAASLGVMAADYRYGTAWRVMPLHLWFLEVLLLFSLATWAVARWAPRALAALEAGIGQGARQPAVLLLGAVPTALIAVAHPELRPDLSFWPEWQSLVHFGLFYCLGLGLTAAAQAGRLETLQRQAPLLTGLGVALGAWLFTNALQWTPTGAALTSLVSWLLTLGLLGLALRPLPPSRLVSELVDASYWVYLVHYPMVVVLQAVLVPVALPVLLKYLLVVLGAFAASLATFHLLVRLTPLAGYLGVRKRPLAD